MAKNVKLNIRGISAVLKSAQPKVDEVGEEIAAGAAGNYRYVPNPHHRTARGHVETADIATARSDARTHELLKSLGRSIR